MTDTADRTEPTARRALASEPAGTTFKRALPLLCLCAVVGGAVVAIAFAISAAREERSWGEPVYWAGLLLIVVPCGARLAGRSASRGERLALVVLVGLALLAVESFIAPLSFSNHDEFGHLRETYDILSTRHLIAYNPIQREYSYFPGIDLATSTFSHISGLSIFASWKMVLIGVRIMEVLALFLVLERASNSARLAGLGVLVYMCNPSFIYFDAHFAYESFALPFGILLLQRVSGLDQRGPRVALWILFALTAGVLVVSHHLASYLFVAILVALALLERMWGRWKTPLPRSQKRLLSAFAVFATMAVVAWTAIVARSTISSYLGPVLSEAITSTVGFVSGTHAAEKTLFEAQNKQASPLLEQAIGFLAVGLLLVLLAVGLWRLWRGRALDSPLRVVLAGVGLAYPATLLLRLTLNGSETSDRASAYVYLGLGYIVATGIFGAERARGSARRGHRRFWRLPRRSVPRLLRPPLTALVIALLLVGGIVVGTARTERLPGKYYPAVTARAGEDPESLAAARWVDTHLAHHQALFSDIVNRLLMSSYGRENTVCCYIDDLLVPELMLTSTFTAKDMKLIRLEHITLLVVDMRLDKPSLSTHLFFERSDGGPYYKPLSAQALTKFRGVLGIKEVFESGNIAIYDTATLATHSTTMPKSLPGVLRSLRSAPRPTRAVMRALRDVRRSYEDIARAFRYIASNAGATASRENLRASTRAAAPRRPRSSGRSRR